MKKILSALLIIVTLSPLFSQSFSFGIHGSANSTWLINSSITDSKDKQTYSLALGPNGGIMLMYHINEYVGLQVNGLYGLHAQAYNYTDSSLGVAKLSVLDTKNTLFTIDIPAMLYLELESGGYAELGAQYSIVQKAIYSGKLGDIDVSKSFETSNIAGILGVGMAHSITDNLFLKVGFRFSYGFTDLKGVDAKGIPLDLKPFYKMVNPTNSMFAGVHLSFYYKTDPKTRHRGGPGKRRRA